MNKKNQEHIEKQPAKLEKPALSEYPVQVDQDLGATKANFLSLLNSTEIGLDTLRTYTDVEDLAIEVIGLTPEALELAARIKLARTCGDGAAEATLVAKQRAFYEDICREIALMAGIESDDEIVESQNSDYRIRLAKAHGDNLCLGSPEEALGQLGLLGEDPESGEQVFKYPAGLFPPHIDDKWIHYMDVVKSHIGAINDRSTGVANDTVLIAQLDVIRTAAHNNLSMAIKNFLLVDSWDLEKARRFVIKMRDNALPNIDTAEAKTTTAHIHALVEITKQITGRA